MLFIHLQSSLFLTPSYLTFPTIKINQILIFFYRYISVNFYQKMEKVQEDPYNLISYCIAGMQVIICSVFTLQRTDFWFLSFWIIFLVKLD